MFFLFWRQIQFLLYPLDIGVAIGDDLFGSESRRSWLGQDCDLLCLLDPLLVADLVTNDLYVRLAARFRAAPGGVRAAGCCCCPLLAGDHAGDTSDDADDSADGASEHTTDRAGGPVAFARSLLHAFDQSLCANRSRAADEREGTTPSNPHSLQRAPSFDVGLIMFALR